MLKQAAGAGAISLKGSSDILVDYFFYAVNSILYQRGVYPEASFKKDVQYELSMLVAADEGLINYLKTILAQLKGSLQKLVLVIKCVKTEEVLERWQFNIICETPDSSGYGLSLFIHTPWQR
ncbi:unnamed protein product [Echinostoma caproni]|uniref:HORMA domain-containing protein n=1 Tax=Echinostoma caproni TaxID=27848 RepID=A0A183BF85_9TREM|nr:unnamed protein product [Echinostoma caproni]